MARLEVRIVFHQGVGNVQQLVFDIVYGHPVLLSLCSLPLLVLPQCLIVSDGASGGHGENGFEPAVA